MQTYKTAVLAMAVAGALAGTGWAGGACCSVKKSSACVPASADPAAKQADAGYGVIDTAGLKALLDAGTKAVVVDARTAQWDDGKRIPGAISLPADSSDEAIAAALPDKNALVVAYCANLKCQASAKLATQLVKLGYKNIVKYPDGIEGWVAAGNAANQVEKAK